MELQFKKVGSRYEAEFEATGNFNLHIERKKSGGVAIFQKTSADDQYTSESSWSDNAEAVVNKDFSMLIYPKMIKVVSRAEVTKAIVTMAGESGGSGGGATFVLVEEKVNIEGNVGGYTITDGVHSVDSESGDAPSLGWTINSPERLVLGSIKLKNYNPCGIGYTNPLDVNVTYSENGTTIEIASETVEYAGGIGGVEFKLYKVV